MTDIVERLRRTRADMIGTDDEQHYFDCHEAAAEIERLRQWGRLTDAEREAVEAAIGWIGSPSVDDEAMPEDYLPITATLRGLLERTEVTSE